MWKNNINIFYKLGGINKKLKKNQIFSFLDRYSTHIAKNNLLKCRWSQLLRVYLHRLRHMSIWVEFKYSCLFDCVPLLLLLLMLALLSECAAHRKLNMRLRSLLHDCVCVSSCLATMAGNLLRHANECNFQTNWKASAGIMAQSSWARAPASSTRVVHLHRAINLTSCSTKMSL